MKAIKYIIPVIISILTFQVSLQGQGNLKLEVINFMEKYEQYSSFTKDGLSYEEAYESKFKELFLSGKTNISPELEKYQVFNDIEENSKPPYLKKREYIGLVKDGFSKGVNTKINIKEIGDPKSVKGKTNQSQVEVRVTKKLFGLNRDEEIYQKDFNLTFLVRYKLYNNEISNLRIVSITAKGFPREPSGLFIGINLQPSSTNIPTNGFLNENNTYGNWSQDGKFTFGGGIEVNYYFDNPILGIGARINYTSFQSSSELGTYLQTPVTLVDIDNDIYDLYASGKTYTETVKLNYIDIPVFVKLRFVLHKSRFLNHVFINIGPVFSFGISNAINNGGAFTYQGYYPDYHVVLHDIPEYDYYSDKEFVGTPESKLRSLNISGLAEIGLNIPLSGEKLNMNISLLYQQGFLNLSDDNDDYVMTLGYNKYNALIDSRSKVSTSLFAVNIGILYKIF